MDYGKEGYSHNSVTDIKDMKKKSEEAAVSSTVTDRLQLFYAAAQGTGKVQSVTKARWEVGGQCHAPAALPPGKRTVPVL